MFNLIQVWNVYPVSQVYPVVQKPSVGQDFPMETSWSHSDTPRSVGLSDAETGAWQHKTTDIDVSYGIRTRNPSRRSAADPRVRSRGHRAECTGLFEMIVGVLTTCHTQYTWDSSICIFLFNRTTLQVFVTYLTGALYVHPLWFYRVIQNVCWDFNNLS